MIRDIFVSFKSLFKSKVRNPFFGTLIIVWLLHNWDLVYSLFTFEENWSRVQRIAFIQEYFTEPSFLENMLICVVITFAVLIVSYILLNLTRFITNLSKDVVSPWVSRITDVSSIVLRSKFEEELEEKNGWRQKYEHEQKSRLLLQADFENLEARYKNLLSEEQEVVETKKNKDHIRIKNKYTKLKNKGLIEHLFNSIEKMNTGNTLDDNDKIVRELAKEDLIKYKSGGHAGQSYYQLTELGKSIKDFRQDYDLEEE